MTMAAPNWQLVILPDPSFERVAELNSANLEISQQLTIALSSAEFKVNDAHTLNLPDCSVEDCSTFTQQDIVDAAKHHSTALNLALLYNLAVVKQREIGLNNWYFTLTGRVIELTKGQQQEAFDVSRRVVAPDKRCIAECFAHWLDQHVALLARELGAILSEKLAFVPQNNSYQLQFAYFTPSELLKIKQAISQFDGYLSATLVRDYAAKQQGLHQIVNRDIVYNSSLDSSELLNALQQALLQLDVNASITYERAPGTFVISRLNMPYLARYISALTLFSVMLLFIGFVGWRYRWRYYHQQQLDKLASAGQIQAWLDYVDTLPSKLSKAQWLAQKQSYATQLSEANAYFENAQVLYANKQYSLAQQQLQHALALHSQHESALLLQHTLQSYQRGQDLLQQAQQTIQTDLDLAQVQLREAQRLNPDLSAQCQQLAQQYKLDLAAQLNYEAEPTADLVADTAVVKPQPKPLTQVKLFIFLALLLAASAGYWLYQSDINGFNSLIDGQQILNQNKEEILSLQASTAEQSLLEPETSGYTQQQTQDLNAWQQASQIDTQNSYLLYLRDWPNGKFVMLASAALQAKQQDKEAWQLAQEQNNSEAYQRYLSMQAQGQFRTLAKQHLSALQKAQQQQQKLSAIIAVADDDYFQQKNYPEAFYYYQQGAELDDAYAQYQLANMYYQGQGTALNYLLAANWYEKAATQGYAEAQLTLGYMYSKGQGVKHSYAHAASWYQQAAQQGIRSAQYNLAYLYAQGQGLTKNYQQAVHWYQLAAEQGDADAQNNLGKLYELGLGVPVDLKKAKALYRQSARQGNQLAKINLSLLP
jgi:TPR repeat protein